MQIRVISPSNPCLQLISSVDCDLKYHFKSCRQKPSSQSGMRGQAGSQDEVITQPGFVLCISYLINSSSLSQDERRETKSLREAERRSGFLVQSAPPMRLWYQQYWVQILALLLHGCVTLHIGFTSLNLPPFLCLPHGGGGMLKHQWPSIFRDGIGLTRRC